MAPEPAVVSGMPNHEALALLSLPDQLSEPQRDGHICVYGGESITTITSIDLGSRILNGRRVFPRACPICVSNEALDALYVHSIESDGCQDCKDGPVCETGRALSRLAQRKALR